MAVREDIRPQAIQSSLKEQNARERITAFTEHFRAISDYSAQSDVRDQKIVKIERGISE
jgi:hypothetical protein